MSSLTVTKSENVKQYPARNKKNNKRSASPSSSSSSSSSSSTPEKVVALNNNNDNKSDQNDGKKLCAEYKTNDGVILHEKYDTNIQLDATNHTYVLKENANKKLKSVTETLGSFLFDAFDPEVSCRRPQSNQYRINQQIEKNKRYEAIFADWEFTKTIGTFFHEIIETFFKTMQKLLSQSIAHDDALNDALKITKAKINNFSELYNPVHLKKEWEHNDVRDFVIEEYNKDRFYKNILHKFDSLKTVYNLIFRHLELAASEYIVYDEESEVAGTIDAVFWANKEKREVIIVDWKTCSNLSLYGIKVKNESSPFFGMSKTKLDKYFCQLHVYTKILSRNYKVKVVASYIVTFSAQRQFVVYHQPNDDNCSCISVILND